MTQPLRAAVVGLGVGEAHARALNAHPQCELRWLHDLDPRRARALADTLGHAAVAETYEQILADSQTRIVAIASYDDAHASQVIAALEAGKHVFVEKPLARTLDELRAVKSAWHGSGAYLASNLVLRAAPLYRWLKQTIADGGLGEVYAFDGDYLYGRVHKITEGWRKDVEGYSVMEGGGVHLVDLMMWLTGQRPHRVSAAGNKIVTRGTSFRYPDYMAATFEFPSGLLGRVTANFGCVHRHQHVVRVFGTRATFILDDGGPRLHESRDSAAEARRLPLATLAASKGDLIPGFVDAIISGADASAATQHDLDVLCACAAADRAAIACAPIEVTYV